MQTIGLIIFILIVPCAIFISFKIARLYSRLYDIVLSDISDAINGKYKSKYKRR